MKKETDKNVINQMAWILNYQPTIGEQHIHIEGQPAKEEPIREQVVTETKKKKVRTKAVRPRETMTFRRKGQVTDGHLTVVFMVLVKKQWIDGNEADFKALFSGVIDEDCIIIWKKTFGKSTLVELFRQMVETGLIAVPDGFTIPSILEGHFKDEDGEWLTGLDKGHKANDKALPTIALCVRMLKSDPYSLLNGGLDDDDDDFRSVYDPYDHQDLQYHKR